MDISTILLSHTSLSFFFRMQIGVAASGTGDDDDDDDEEEGVRLEGEEGEKCDNDRQQQEKRERSVENIFLKTWAVAATSSERSVHLVRSGGEGVNPKREGKRKEEETCCTTNEPRTTVFICIFQSVRVGVEGRGEGGETAGLVVSDPKKTPSCPTHFSSSFCNLEYKESSSVCSPFPPALSTYVCSEEGPYFICLSLTDRLQSAAVGGPSLRRV